MMKRYLLTFAFLLNATALLPASAQTVGAWMSFGMQPFRSTFPVARIVADAAALGLTDLFFFEQTHGAFLHPTKATYGVSYRGMGKRDFLGELLAEADKAGIKVWLTWTTDDRSMVDGTVHHPLYPRDDAGEIIIRDGRRKSGYYDLRSPLVRQMYAEVMDEIAANYMTRHKNIAGIFWHEVDCAEANDNHGDDLDDFGRFCRERFGEEYTGAAWPRTDAADRWWRRAYLYRIDVVSTFISDMATQANKYGLKTAFCYYTPEATNQESWRWGYDAVELEKSCDHQWVAGYGVAGPFYHGIRGIWVDFGPSYRGINVSRHLSTAFHGKALSYFQFFSPIYVDEMRAYYGRIESFTKKYGSYYLGYAGRSEGDMELFYGKENFNNWLKLMRYWQPGESPAKVAILISPTAFVMQHPITPGKYFRENVVSLVEALAAYCDVDGLIAGSRNMSQALSRYDMLVIPEGMAASLAPATYQACVDYVTGGGNLLVVNAPVSTGRPDMTDQVDRTQQLCGLTYRGKAIPAFLKLEAAEQGLVVPEEKLWASSSDIEIGAARVLAVNRDSRKPVLCEYQLGKGRVCFSAIGCTTETGSTFTSLVRRVGRTPIQLSSSDGLRVLETVRSNNTLCLAMWGKGAGTVSVDNHAAGLKGTRFQVKNILTGAVLGELSADELRAGFAVSIEYENQPCILAVGQPATLAAFPGIYASEDVFKTLSQAKRLIENPETTIEVPPGAGPAVGVYHGGFAATSEQLITALQAAGLRAFSLPRIDAQALSRCDAIILPQCDGTTFFNQSKKDIRQFVQDGGGVLFTHDAVGFRRHTPMFPEIGKGQTNPRLASATVVKAHPVAHGFGINAEIRHAFSYDHIALEKGDSGEVILQDAEGSPVVIAGQLGKGKVVLNGMLPGYAIVGDGSSTGECRKPEGDELKLLLNAVKWLADD